LANYIASSVQWHKCYGTLRSRGNTKKPKAPEDIIAKSGIHDSSGIDDSEVIPRNLELLKIWLQNKESVVQVVVMIQVLKFNQVGLQVIEL
jgi:hypothetical protein